MRLSVIVAAHNESASLWQTVRSCVEGLRSGSDYEIVVADDASDDGSVEETHRRFPSVRVVRHPERRGASPTKHLGAREARGDVLIFLDGHTNPQPGAILQLVEDVERVEGRAIVTPAIEALDVERWRNNRSQVGHGYRLGLERFDCGWLPLGELGQVRHNGRTFYESPALIGCALIGCALAVARQLYDDLRGFDPHMRFWGVEDLDFGLKCWLMGFSILHDPEAAVGHRFRESFDNYDVPIEHLVANQLRMARKNFTHTVWSHWVDSCRRRHAGRLPDHPEGLWARAWTLFEAGRPSVEEERAHIQGHRVRDEFWYAERFGLTWPRLQAEAFEGFPAALETLLLAGASPSPSPPPPSICSGANLIQNPGCEEPPPAGSHTPPSWTPISGDWQPQQGGVGGFPSAHGGTYLFWAGEELAGELFQDCDVSAEATRIDAGEVEFSFSAWLNTWASDDDTSQVILEYRSASGAVIESYDSGPQNVDGWTEFTDVRVAPTGTRTIRVRLIAERDSGAANDGYFDDLSLKARCGMCSGMNLIRNPSCEFPGEPPLYWNKDSGDWKRQQGSVGGFPIAHEGTYLLWAGEAQEGQLYQDCDVSAEATRIDAGKVEFCFSAWLNTFASQSDTSRVIVEYRKADGTVLETYDTGARNDTQWTQYTDIRIAPAGTRTIRIRLWATRVGAGPSNDGYFDDLSLTARCGSCSGINLIRNPGCEFPGEPPLYWNEELGDWKPQEGGVDLFPPAHGGKYLFWAGNVALGKLHQDVDVSDQATQIDNGEIRFRFSGWLNTYGDTDTSQAIVEYRKADDTVLASYDTGVQQVSDWTNYTDARIAPSGTRKVRVQLQAVRNSGTANDGYFDDLSLTTECNVCGATLRFLDNSNQEIPPESKALGVSNRVTNDGTLPATSGPDDTSTDPENFRLEVEDAQVAGGSVEVTLEVGNRGPITYTLDKKSGDKYRGEFLRLVTDSFDDQVHGNQTVLCQLGEVVTLSYTRAGATCTDERRIGIGRPISEDDNGSDQLKHDIREVKRKRPGQARLTGGVGWGVGLFAPTLCQEATQPWLER